MTAEVSRLTSLEQLAPDEQARRQLTAVWPELNSFESFELRCLDMRKKPTSRGPRLFLDSIEAVVEAAMQYRETWDVFVGVGTRACPSALSMTLCAHPEKGADHVSRLKAVWGDFDAKTPDELENLTTTLIGLTLPPTVLVGSGTGLHGYWCLTEPTSELARVEKVNRGLRSRYGADNAIDAARILRVAGTSNHKAGQNLPVRLLVAPDV